jgi:hypothetical protein
MISYDALIITVQVFHSKIHVVLTFNLEVVFFLPSLI